MIPARWRGGEVAVLGLARTGMAAARWLARNGFKVYASDSGEPPTPNEELDKLRAGGVTVELGGHDLARVKTAALVIVSPGIPPEAPVLVAAREGGIEIVAELDLAAAALDSTKLVVVTGTNGKTTTTSLVGQILQRAEIPCVVAGNIGEPLIDAALYGTPPEWAVVEASSFQLHDCHTLSPDIGVLTNLAPDHLDRYVSMEAYFSDKKRLFKNASENSIWVTPAGDTVVADLKGDVPGTTVQWGLSEESGAAYWDRERDRLVLDGEVLIERDDLGLLGDHNVANALAAALVCSRIGVARQVIAGSLKAAPPLRNRLEIIAEADVRWINDSKATNVSSAAVAIAAMRDNYVLLMGGRHKGESYTRLGESLAAGECAGVIAFGEAAQLIEADLGSFVAVSRVDGLADAVAMAFSLRPHTVLFSPACSSFDEFRDYEHRGGEFRRMVGRS